MRLNLLTGVVIAVSSLAATLPAAAGGSPSETPQRGAGAGGAGAPADGPSSNQPGSAAQPNSAATPGPGTEGSPGNASVNATQPR